MNRREVTQYLMAASISAAAAVSRDASAGLVPEPISKAPLLAVILDHRYAVARRFADALAGGATARIAALGEAVTVWRNECRPRLSAHVWRLAGMTTYCDFMLLRACARESGGRLVQMARHDFRKPGTLVHEVSGGEWGETLANALRHDDWAYRLAKALAGAPEHAIRDDEPTARVAVDNASTDRPGTLVSWLIARTDQPRFS